MSHALVEIEALRKSFPVRRGVLQREVDELWAVAGVDLQIRAGETVALAGESGSGKTTLARCVLKLLDATDGTVRFDGVDLSDLSSKELRQRRRSFQMVFQDPTGSLNPRMKVGEILAEPLAVHGVVPPEQRARRVDELLELVGLPREAVTRYPHEFSGGQRQRIGIARALAPEPKFIVADEPVAALDVSVRAQILNLLADLQDRLGLALLFIAHDLAVVEQMADRVGILYLGRMVELADTARLLEVPQHPYTVSLLAAIPVPDPSVDRRSGSERRDPGNPSAEPAGCAFHARCPIASERCKKERPEMLAVEPGHEVACHHPGELAREPMAAAGNGTFSSFRRRSEQ